MSKNDSDFFDNKEVKVETMYDIDEISISNPEDPELGHTTWKTNELEIEEVVEESTTIDESPEVVDETMTAEEPVVVEEKPRKSKGTEITVSRVGSVTFDFTVSDKLDDNTKYPMLAVIDGKNYYAGKFLHTTDGACTYNYSVVGNGGDVVTYNCGFKSKDTPTIKVV